MTTAQTQKALLLHKEGGRYTVGDVPIPRPGPKDVLVKVEAAALNPLDWKIAIPPYSAFIPQFPFITGSDGAGTVVEVGDEVADLKPGDIIAFQGSFEPSLATMQQFCVVRPEFAARIPENISFDQAASVPSGIATIILALYNQHPNYPRTLRFTPIWEEGGQTAFAGKPAFIIGGASSVGQYAIQMAKFAGSDPIIATASPHNTALLTSLGATHVLDRSLPGDTILTKLSELAGGKPLEYAFDAVSSPETMSVAYRALAPGGALAVVLPDVVPEEVKVPGDGKRIAFPAGNCHLPENREIAAELFKRITEWLAKGIVKPNPVEVLPRGLAGALEGLERLEKNQVSGKKLIVRPQETA